MMRLLLWILGWLVYAACFALNVSFPFSHLTYVFPSEFILTRMAGSQAPVFSSLCLLLS